MKILIISACAIIATLAIVAIIVPWIRVRGEGIPKVSIEMEMIVFATRWYRENIGEFPTNSTKAILSALRGNNPKHLQILENMDGDPETMLDPWGHQYRIIIQSNRTIQVISAGPNGIFGDKDDKEHKSEPSL